MRSWLIVLTFLLSLNIGVAARGAEPTRATAAQVREWMSQLDHDDFAVRETAAVRLSRAGALAIKPLAEGILSPSPEVAWRSSETLERMAMEGDEATMDQVVSVLGTLARRGKPGLALFASQMRERQRAFRHARATAELRKLGGQVAGGAYQAEAADLGDGFGFAVAEEDFIIEEAPAIEAIEIVEMEVDEAPVGGDKPGWLALLEALRFVEPMPVPELDLEIVEGEAIELADEEHDEPAAARRAVADRVAAALLPGRVGGAFRRALGLPVAKPAEEKMAAEEALADVEFDAAKDLRLPTLEEAVEALEEPARDLGDALEAVEADAVDVEVVEVEAAGMGFAMVDPVFFGGMIAADGSASPGYLSLGRQWRGGDQGLKHLKDLNGISSLQIEHAPLSDAALPHIAKLASLKHLQVRGGKFSREALQAFHRQRPEVSVMAMGEGMMGVTSAFNAEGCVLDSVFPESAAHVAGLQAGDKVTAIAGDPIADFSDLTIAVSTRQPGDAFKVVFERDGKQQEVELTLKARGPGQ